MGIQIQVRNKVAVNLTPEKVIVCGNSGYDVEFTFDDEWESEEKKTARFVYRKGGRNYFEDVVFTGTIAKVPVLSNINHVLVGVYAGELITSTPAVVECEKSILCGTAERVPLTPSQYDEIMELLAGGVGLGAAEKKVILSLFKATAYTEDVSTKVAELEALWSVSYKVSYSLTGVTASNNAVAVVEGGTYSSTLTAEGGYTLTGATVKVTMGGADITATAYSGGVITIASVTGAVVISVVAREIPSYSVTNKLTGVTTSNTASKVSEGGSYSATLTVEDGYILNTLTITMGGVDITATAYGDGYILIPEVTGDVVITALASEPQYIDIVTVVDPGWDGLVAYSDDGTNTIFNGTYYKGKLVMSRHKTETDAGAVVVITNPTESDISVTAYAGSAASPMADARNNAYYCVSASQTIRPGQTITVPFTVKAGDYAFAVCNNVSVEIAIQGVLDIHTPTNEYELATRKPDATNWYTDGGETAYATNYYLNHAYIAEPFTEDTELHITIVPTTSGISDVKIGCMTAVSGNAIVHYAKQIVGKGREGVVVSANYIVKAGYYFTTNLGGTSHEIYIEKV